MTIPISVPIPDQFMDFGSWVDNFNLVNVQRIPYILMFPGEDWQHVAGTIILEPNVAALAPPDPAWYDSWLEWARDLSNASVKVN